MSNHHTNETDIQHNAANQVFHNSVGSVHQTNYLGLFQTNASQETDFFTYDEEQDNGLTPIPQQDRLFDDYDEFTDTDSETATATQKKGRQKTFLEPAPSETKPYEVPISLRKRYQDPRRKTTTVITPQANKTLSTPKEKTPTDITETAITEAAASPPHMFGNAAGNTIDISSRLNREPPSPDIGRDVQTENTLKHVLNRDPNLIYHSPFLAQEFKPTNDNLDLTTELESLRPLILSQHKAFEQRIKDLGAFNLNITKTIEKKSTSLQHLINNDKIPRSLRIKCELTTSPEFSNDPEFLKIKNDLHQEVNNFIQKGTTLMTAWARRNIRLLTLQRCFNYLKKALQILEGLTSFYTDSIGAPKWKSVANNQPTLFLFKAFLSDNRFKANDFITYLNLTSEEILLIGAKLILRTDSEEDAIKVLSGLNLTDINPENQADILYLTEILTNFSDILQFTTIGIWKAHKERSKKTTAGLNLSSKMKAMDTLSATEATALAITKATENVEMSQLTTSEANLRIENLERSSRRQEQKANEIINQLKTKQSQKNFKGSHRKEPMTSPPTASVPALTKIINNKKRHVVDLTLEETEAQDSSTLQHQKNFSSRKRQKQNQNGIRNRSLSSRPKTIQWSDKEDIKTYHPHQPAFNPFTQQLNHKSSASQTTQDKLAPPPSHNTTGPANVHTTHTGTSYFQQALPPQPPPHYLIQAPGPIYTYPITNLGSSPYHIHSNQYQSQPLKVAIGNPFGSATLPEHNIPRIHPFGTLPMPPSKN